MWNMRGDFILKDTQDSVLAQKSCQRDLFVEPVTFCSTQNVICDPRWLAAARVCSTLSFPGLGFLPF